MRFDREANRRSWQKIGPLLWDALLLAVGVFGLRKSDWGLDGYGAALCLVLLINRWASRYLRRRSGNVDVAIEVAGELRARSLEEFLKRRAREGRL